MHELDLRVVYRVLPAAPFRLRAWRLPFCTEHCALIPGRVILLGQAPAVRCATPLCAGAGTLKAAPVLEGTGILLRAVLFTNGAQRRGARPRFLDLCAALRPLPTACLQSYGLLSVHVRRAAFLCVADAPSRVQALHCIASRHLVPFHRVTLPSWASNTRAAARPRAEKSLEKHGYDR